ncbi:MAG: hypothetical protein QXP56_07685 [Archaeoglobaceae archaeon]
MNRLRGETVSLYIYFRDENKALFDPDIVEAKIYKPNGSLAENLTVSRIEVGKYSVSYTFPDDADLGDWFIIVKAGKGSFVEKEKIIITVR